MCPSEMPEWEKYLVCIFILQGQITFTYWIFKFRAWLRNWLNVNSN